MSLVSAPSGSASIRAGAPLSPRDFGRLRRRAIFDCCKWDPQFEDVSTLAPFPLLISADTWRKLACSAEALACETLAAEAELVTRPELHRALALPRRVLRVLTNAASAGGSPGVARLIRFDFHLTGDGWRISEANTDVPGGLNEASGFSSLVAAHYPGTRIVGDAAVGYVEALLGEAPPRPYVALVHATAYTDDHQMMRYLSRLLEARGARPLLVSPVHLRWTQGRAHVETDAWRGPVDLLVRFFPGEWLPSLPAASGWEHLFAGTATPASNPATALLTQSKRFPLVWDALRTPIPTWRALLPETRDPREVPWRGDEEWILKPALGRVGHGVGIVGTTPAKDWKKIARGATWRPRHWVAQRRFASSAVAGQGGPLYPCIGVYTVDSRAVGAYGRLADQPLIDSRARDVAVLLEAE